MNRDLCTQLISLRGNHPAWLLLASQRAPITLSCLKTLFENNQTSLTLDDAVETLAEAFTLYANDTQFEIAPGADHTQLARKELRQWLKRNLIAERHRQLMATDALQKSFLFLDSLENQSMTSTASRLATVQREIENLAAMLSHKQDDRAQILRNKITSLKKELRAVERGEFEVLEGPKAKEGIREVYQLAVSLKADFRRVDDSYRKADKTLRQRIISENNHRGEIVDDLLSSHDALVETAEGQVFESFHQQLVQTAELSKMKQRLRTILDHQNTEEALEQKQKKDLRSLVPRLVTESARVIQARARSERDVRGFLKSGLADEQIRVGAILQDIFQVALNIDWQRQKIRRSPSPLPPVAVATPNLPLLTRFLIKDTTTEAATELDLSRNETDINNMDDEFWNAYQALDREALFEATLDQLKASGKPFTIKELAAALPPTHDLETLAYWLAIAREAGSEINGTTETIDLFHEQDGWTRFHTPRVELSYTSVAELESGEME